MFKASSVLNALEPSVKIIGHAKCPMDICITDPAKCQKGLTQTCPQEVKIIYEHDNHNKIVNFRFFFTISPYDHDGFIDENNQFLNILIIRKIINPDKLVKV